MRSDTGIFFIASASLISNVRPDGSIERNRGGSVGSLGEFLSLSELTVRDIAVVDSALCILE